MKYSEKFEKWWKSQYFNSSWYETLFRSGNEELAKECAWAAWEASRLLVEPYDEE